MVHKSNSKHDVNQRKADVGYRRGVSSLLTPEQQIERLDARLGKGVGASKERERLLGQIRNRK